MEWQSEVYYKAAVERIQEALHLHTNGYYVVAMYLSGLAVECLLRAYRLLEDSTFDERHDLWLLWKSTLLANPHSEFYDKRIDSAMSTVKLLWRNDYRFKSIDSMRKFFKETRRAHGIKGDALKYNSQRLFDAAAEIIRIGTQKWHLLRKK
ncbi:MAG: hypothetical protein AAB354_16245 [candidate division KSB1 bacterium]